MQSFTTIAATTLVKDSLAPLMSNDQSLQSCFSGTTFPASPVVGQLCFRTDLNQLFECKTAGATPVWAMIADLTKTYGSAAYLDAGTAANDLVQLDANAKLPAVDGSQLTGLATVVGFKNVLINGDFSINQRGAGSGAATGYANEYMFDRWRIVVSGQSIIFVANGRGNTVTAPAGGLEQVIEAANIEGGTYALSWSGTATATINGTAVANGGTISLPANTNATVRFSSGTVSKAQLELGNKATPFELRPFGMELMLCQRYFETGSINIHGIAPSSGPFFFDIPGFFKVTKRVTPTMGGTAFVYSGCSSGEFTDVNTCGFSCGANASVSGQFSYGTPWTADAEL